MSLISAVAVDNGFSVSLYKQHSVAYIITMYSQTHTLNCDKADDNNAENEIHIFLQVDGC